ncbi:MAG: glycosyltransferase [Candidatus Kapaibacteriota bacterium]
MKKTVLIISYSFPPMGLSGVVRTSKMAKALAKNGWNVVVLSATPKVYLTYDETLLQELIDAGVHIYSTPSKTPPKQDASSPGWFERTIMKPLMGQVYFPDSAIRWKRMAIAAADGIMNDYDVSVILSVSPPLSNFVITDLIAERHQIPFLLDYQDGWTKGITVDQPQKQRSSAHMKLEHHLLNRAARIIVPSRIAKEQMIKDYRFLEHEDVMIIPAGYDRDDLIGIQPTHPPSSKMIIMHTGKADMSGYLPALFQGFAEVVKTNPEIQREVMISLPGIVDDALSTLIDKLGIRESVHQPGYIAHRDLFEAMSKSDVLLAETTSTYQIPRKIYEYIAMKKPMAIIAPEQSALTALAKDSAAAFPLHEISSAAIATYISTLHSTWKLGKLPKQKPGFAETFAMDNFVEDISIALTKAIRIS